ncbi:MAG: hypothetical protein Hyperionvirus2_36 [Hyperionvirus sp.]|uniref:Uncharacterized protein n=1 Tax=Hyperionvirus sp. TaxID=2487770 RepID=A0A3G5A665_9VIRU|nr:MAG: hypothetical protein Hyperionvirus2_36 [Hyperionvirus sp.]
MSGVEKELRDQIERLEAEKAKLILRVKELEGERYESKAVKTDLGAKFIIGMKFLQLVSNAVPFKCCYIYGSFIPAMFNALSGAALSPNSINIFVRNGNYNDCLKYLCVNIKRCLNSVGLGFKHHADLLEIEGFKIIDVTFDDNPKSQRMTILLIKESEVFSVIIDTYEPQPSINSAGNFSICQDFGINNKNHSVSRYDDGKINVLDFLVNLINRQTYLVGGELLSMARFGGIELPKILKGEGKLFGMVPKITVNFENPSDSTIEVKCDCSGSNKTISLAVFICRIKKRHFCEKCHSAPAPVHTDVPRIILPSLNFVRLINKRIEDLGPLHTEMADDIYNQLNIFFLEAKQSMIQRFEKEEDGSEPLV